MSKENYISAFCTISNGRVIKNGKSVFENPGVDLTSFLLSVYQHFGLNYPKFHKMDNLSKLGWLAAEILLAGSFDKNNYQPEETGILLANANSSLDDDFKYWDSVKEMASPSLFVYTLPNIVIGEICIRNNFKGEHSFFIQHEFDSDFITRQVNYLLDKNILQACICGWVDVLGEDYKAVLYLAEKKTNTQAMLFSSPNVAAIFNKN